MRRPDLIPSKISLRRAVHEAGKTWTASEGMSLAEDIADSYTATLIARGVIPPAEAASFLAERELISRVRDIVDELKAADNWTEHVTLAVFERIRADFGDLYARAVATGLAPQINRRIGALVRHRLDAHPRLAGNSPEMANVSRHTPALIRTYTLLHRKPEE